MLKKKKNLIKLMALTLILTLITGCWGSKEIEDLSLVLGVGIDKTEEDYVTMLQVVRTSMLQSSGGGSGGGGGGEEKPVIIYSAAGRTIFEAVRNMSKQSTRQLFFSHNQVYVIGEDAAKSGIGGLLDFISRDVELLYTSLLVICPGKASNLLQTEVEEQLPATAIANIFNNVDKHGQSVEVNIKDISAALYSAGESYILPSIRSISAAGGQENHFVLDGAGVFKRDKMVGRIDTDQMRGYLLLIGKLEGGVMVVKDPTTPGNQITLELLGVKSKLKPLMEEGRPVVEVYVTETVALANENILHEQLTKDNKAAIEHQGALGIVSQIENTFATAQLMQADIFGFADLFNRKRPEDFKKMATDWDSIFSEMEIRVYADCQIKSTGLRSGLDYKVR